MYTLFIDTHLYDINVVLYKDGNVYLHKCIDKSVNNNALLVPTIMGCISNIKFNDIIVVNGPGSFTGVRTGVTVAKTLSYLLNIPIKTVSYLDIMDYSLDCNENLVGFYDNSGILKVYTFDEVTVGTKVPSMAMKVTGVYNNKVYYKITFDNYYTISGGDLNLFKGNQGVASGTISTLGSVNEITGSIDISDCKFNTGDEVSLNLYNIKINVNDSFDPDITYRFIY